MCAYGASSFFFSDKKCTQSQRYVVKLKFIIWCAFWGSTWPRPNSNCIKFEYFSNVGAADGCASGCFPRTEPQFSAHSMCFADITQLWFIWFSVRFALIIEPTICWQLCDGTWWRTTKIRNIFKLNSSKDSHSFNRNDFTLRFLLIFKEI